MSEFPGAVSARGCSFNESGYEDTAGNYWTAAKLYAAAKEQGCKKFKFPLGIYDLSNQDTRYQSGRVIDLAECVRRCMETDLARPVLLSPLGSVMDGHHRIIKAVALNKKYFWAVKLKQLPKPDRTKANPYHSPES